MLFGFNKTPKLDLSVKDSNGNIIIELNYDQIKKNKIDKKGIQELKDLHLQKYELYEKAKITDDSDELRIIGIEVELVEFALQLVWGFDLDKNFHKFWKIPKCICNPGNNEILYGETEHCLNTKCPVHGDKIECIKNKMFCDDGKGISDLIESGTLSLKSTEIIKNSIKSIYFVHKSFKIEYNSDNKVLIEKNSSFEFLNNEE